MGLRELAQERRRISAEEPAERWSPGEVILWTYRNPRFPRLRDEYPVTVVSDDEQGLVVWLAPGTPVLSQVLADGAPIRSAAGPAMFTLPRAQAVRTWFGSGIVVAFPPDACFTVSFFELEDGTRAAYYVNLELPVVRTRQGMECVDLVLDILVRQGPTYRFKDEDELEFARQAGVFSGDDELFIREAAQEALALVEVWAHPFDAGLEDFTPNPGWSVPQLPADATWDIDLRGGPAAS